MLVREALATARRSLADHPEGALEAELLLAHALDATRSFLYANPELPVPGRRADAFRALLKRRCRGEPLAYLTGVREFWSLPLRVTPAVLIPRPDTETLVSACLDRLPRQREARIADLGTGSGAIALALARERPRAMVWATDCAPAALEVARENRARLGIDNIRFALGQWFHALGAMTPDRFDLVASNPPYVASDDPHLRHGDCRFEPQEALTDGGDGLGAIRVIIEGAPARLVRGGWLALEHGHEQGAAVRELMAAGGFGDIETVRDIENRERVTVGRVG